MTMGWGVGAVGQRGVWSEWHINFNLGKPTDILLQSPFVADKKKYINNYQKN